MLENTIYYKNWENNTAIEAETIMLLELIEVLLQKEKHI